MFAERPALAFGERLSAPRFGKVSGPFDARLVTAAGLSRRRGALGGLPRASDLGRHRVTREDFADSVRRMWSLTPETAAKNATGQAGGAVAGLPPMAVTAGMCELRAACRIGLAEGGRPWQRRAWRQAAAGAATVEHPLTLLRGQPDPVIPAGAPATD